MVAAIAALAILPACNFVKSINEDLPSLWFRFNESAAPFQDTVGNRVASVAGSPEALITPRKHAVSRDGVWAVDKAASGGPSLVAPAGGPAVASLAAAAGVSVEMWVTGQVVADAQPLVRRSAGTNTDWLLSQVDDSYRWEVYDSTGVILWSVTGGTVKPGFPQQVVGTFSDGGTEGVATLYVDGESVGTTGSVAGTVGIDTAMDLQLLEGGPVVADELIAFDDKDLAPARVQSHYATGMPAPDSCSGPLAPRTELDAPVTILSTASGLGAPTLSSDTPVTIDVGGLGDIETGAVDFVEFTAVASAAGAVRIWPAGWTRPAVATIPEINPGTPVTIVVPVGDDEAIRVEASTSMDLTLAATAAWTDGGLRPATPGFVFDGAVAAGEGAAITVAPHAPAGVTAVMLAISVNSSAGAGVLSTPDPGDPTPGVQLTVDHPATATTVMAMAQVSEGKTSVRSSVGANLKVQVVGWAVNPLCLAAETVAPQVAITSPASGASINATHFTFDMTGTVSDTGSGVASIELAVDGTPMPDVPVDVNGKPGTWSAEASVPNGTHTVQATARDFAGNSASASISVSSVSPAAGVVVTSPELVTPQTDLAASVTSFDAQAYVLRVSGLPGLLSQLEPGSTIAVDPIAPILPDGLFHEVVRIQGVPGGWVLQLKPASMFNAFRQIEVTQEAAFSGSPTPDEGTAGRDSNPPSIGRDFDWAACDHGEYEPDPFPDPAPEEEPGAPLDNICAGVEGTIDIGLDFDFAIYWHWGSPRLDRFKAVAFAEVKTNAFVQAWVEKTWEDSAELAEIELPSIPVWGPVNLTPEIDIDLMFRASVEATARIEFSEFGLLFEAGAEYVDGEVQPVFDATPTSPDMAWPRLAGGAKAELEIGPRVELELLVNGLIGPQIWVEPLKLGLVAEAEAAVDPNDPEANANTFEVNARLFGEWGANLAIEIDLGPLDWEWESESLHGELYTLATFLDLSVDLGRGCAKDECTHIVLPPYQDQPTQVEDIAENGVAVGITTEDTYNWWWGDAVWWNGNSAPEILPKPDGVASATARAVSPNGQYALGVGSLASVQSYPVLRWTLSGGAPEIIGSEEGGSAEVCGINNQGTALLAVEVGNDHVLARWPLGGSLELLGIDAAWGDQRMHCGARIIADGTVVANVDTTQFGPIVVAVPAGGSLVGLGGGTFHDVNDDGVVVGSQGAGWVAQPAVWHLDSPGVTTILPLPATEGPSGLGSADGVDGNGNVFGSADGRNARWKLVEGDWIAKAMPTSFLIYDVTDSGWVFGMGGPPAHPNSPNVPSLVQQWHNTWFNAFLDPVLGDITDRDNEGAVDGYSDTEERTIYKGGPADAWYVAPRYTCLAGCT